MLLSCNSSDFKMAGNCVFYENGGFKCEKKTLVISQGIVKSVRPFDSRETDILTLDDECVIFPGLVDLHSHVDYNMIQVWNCLRETQGRYWDNRHEWRNAQSYSADIKGTQKIISNSWQQEILSENNATITIGDVMLYLAELQAACGGTTVLQENAASSVALKFGSLDYDEEDEEETPELLYSFAVNLAASDVPGSHSKYLVLRSTGVAKDIALPEDEYKDTSSVLDMFRPEKNDDTLNPKRSDTYLPHRSTSGWNMLNATVKADGQPKNLIDVLLEAIKAIKDGDTAKKKHRGFLIHIAEGRAGNIFWAHGESNAEYLREMDAYSRREFLGFKEAILRGEKAGDFSSEHVRQLHINFIHGCGIDFSSDDDCKFLVEHGIGVIWSPVSNLLLYGDTPAAYDLFNYEGLLMGIGSDWSPSGSKHVWDECKFAKRFMEKYASDKSGIMERILKAVTVNASEIIDCPRIGNIKEGVFADFFILRAAKAVKANLKTALETFFGSNDSNVELVMLGGNPIYGEMNSISRFTAESQFYAMLATDKAQLKSKRVYIPEHFRAKDFDKLYQEYIRLVKAAGLDVSLVRSEDDEEYCSIINKLQASYPGMTLKHVHVDARNVWNDTKVDVDGAVWLKYESGHCCISPSIRDCDANGDDRFKAKEGYLLPEANEGVLMAKFGKDGLPVVVGRERIFTVEKGRLYLGVNDDVDGRYGEGYKDNSGEFIVRVRAEGKEQS